MYYINSNNNELNLNIDNYINYLNSNEINPFLLCTNYNHKIGELLPLEEMKNIMDAKKVNLTEDDYDYDDEIDSIYYIKNHNNSKIDLQSTDNSTKLSLEQDKSNEEKKEDFFKKIINFKTVLHQKRGRKEKVGINKKKNKKCHSANDFDNIQRKIQVHFIKFLIKLANDAIKTILGKKNKLYFKDIKYELKKIVNHKYVENLKKLNYADIIQMNISTKNKNFDEDTNKKVFLKICQNSEELKKMFGKNFLYIFQKYYFGLKNDIKEINFEGIKIILSSKTKGFYHLLKKNEINEEIFKKVVDDVYFSDKNYLLEKKFITIDYEK